jgi:hypothetical protein
MSVLVAFFGNDFRSLGNSNIIWCSLRTKRKNEKRQTENKEEVSVCTHRHWKLAIAS